jgi:hypothetical protein
MKTLGELQKHGLGCQCLDCFKVSKCGGGYYSTEKRGQLGGADGKYEQQAATAQASSMEHGQMASKHRDMTYGYNQMGPKMPVDEKAKHIMAANAHDQASDHYAQAASDFNNNLPMSGKERMKLATEAGDKANKMTAKCDMGGGMDKFFIPRMTKLDTRDGKWMPFFGTVIFVDGKSGNAIDGDETAQAAYNKMKEKHDKNINQMDNGTGSLAHIAHKA